MAVDKTHLYPLEYPLKYPLEATRADETQRLIFVTNRGPVEHSFGHDGSIKAQRGAGGVVSGLLWAAEDRPIAWISLAKTEADRQVAEDAGDGTTQALQAIDAPSGVLRLSSRLVSVPSEMYRRYYDGFSNRVLWFAQHGMLRPDAVTPQSHLDWAYGYAPVNEAIAQAVIDELDASGEMTPVMFQDYHLYLAPKYVRERRPDACLLHFIHVPWPSTQDWAAVPVDYMYAVYRGLAANDVIGFQTEGDADRFLEGARRFLPGATIMRNPNEIFWRGRRTQVRAYPIAIMPSSIRESAESHQAQMQAQQIMREMGIGEERKLILRVDRLEPTKNIVRGFQAYEHVLETHPELWERVSFLALLVPTRESLEEYQDYAEQVRSAIERVNQRFGTPKWQPVKAIYGNDHSRALACMQHYDVLLVNPLADGMNLVAKEGGLLNRRQGAMVLSKTAGAYEQLQAGVLGIEPDDPQATAWALYRALTLPLEMRTKLAGCVKDILLEEDAGRWLKRQCDDLFHYTAGRSRYSAPKLMSFPRQPDKAKVNGLRSPAKTLPLSNRERLSKNSDPA